MAGMTEHVDFQTEHSFDTDEGRRRPDALVRLPGGKSVVVDAKTPLDAYLTALETSDPAEQAAALANHARQLKAHVRSLASKEYWNALPEAPDFVVMFVPGEAFYSAAIEHDPDLFETALESRVLVCSPTTLIALVKSIAYGWQQEKLARNAQEVARQARELYQRLATYGGHMDKLGRGLRQAVDNYNKAVGALESRVLPSARRFESLGVLPEGSEIEEPAPVEHEPRALSASEFSQEVEGAT
jgi:DNA recombination protein RmuC